MLLVFVLLSAAPAWAEPADEEGAIPPQQLELLAKEPPLTQADIDFFISLANAAEEDADDLLEKSGLSETRISLVLTKISIGMMVAAGAPASMVISDDLPDVFRPSPDEMTLIEKNLDKLIEDQ